MLRHNAYFIYHFTVCVPNNNNIFFSDTTDSKGTTTET